MGAHEDQAMTVLMCVQSPYHAESSRQRGGTCVRVTPHKQVCARHAHCHSSSQASQHPESSRLIAFSCTLPLLAAPCGCLGAMAGLGQQSRVLLHHKRHPKPKHGGQGIGGRASVGGGRMSLSKARTRAHMQTRAMARAGEYHLALGPPTRDATRATKAIVQNKSSMLKALAGCTSLPCRQG